MELGNIWEAIRLLFVQALFWCFVSERNGILTFLYAFLLLLPNGFENICLINFTAEMILVGVFEENLDSYSG